MDNRIPEQHIDSLPKDKREEAYEQVARLAAARLNGIESEEELARKAGFPSVEAMRSRLEVWGLTGLLPLGSKPKPVGERKARGAEGEPVELPLPTSAMPLFENTVRFIEGEITYVAGLKEVLQGGRFMSEFAGEATEGGYGRMVGGGHWFPNSDLTRLIGSCLVEYGFRWETVEHLLEALHPNPAEAEREQLVHFLYGSEGLARKVPQIAALIRGAPKIGRGRKAEPISAADHAVVLGIRALMEEGISEEEAAQAVLEKHGLDQTEYGRLRDIARGLR